MTHKARCPKCDRSVTHIKLEYIPIHAASRVQGKCIAFLCSHCNAILGTGFDPELLVKEVEIPTGTDAYLENITADETGCETSIKSAPVRQINWPIIRTQQELAEVAELHRKQENIYPLQGKPVGEILKQYGIADEQTLLIVSAIQKRGQYRNKAIGETLVEIGIISRDELIRTLLIQNGKPMVDILSIDIPPELTINIPLQIVREKLAVPIGQYHNTLYLAVSDPFTFADRPFFSLMTGMKVRLVFAPLNEIANRIH